MRVPEVMLKCVGFVGAVTHRDADGVDGELCATGFFVSVPSQNLPGTYCYFVTAKHVATDLKDSEVYFLVNKKGGGTTRMNGVGDAWHLHPTDKTADVVVTQMAVTPDADIVAVPLGDFMTPLDLRDQTIGIGDEVFSTGLFKPVTSSQSLLPIVRHGNVAMLPNEQIETDLGYADVYLVEARSIGGISGSPVWARKNVWSEFQNVEGKKATVSLVGPGKLLGMMHGHWDIDEARLNEYDIIQKRKGVNLGVAIVVPAMKILETLHGLPLIAQRNDEDRKVMKRSVPGTDSLKLKAKEEQPAFTKQDFEAALKKASRKKQE